MERGSSLIEVLVALALFLLITTGVGNLLIRSKEMTFLSENREKAAFEVAEKTEADALSSKE